MYYKSEANNSQVSMSLHKMKVNNSVAAKRFSMDANSLLFDHSSQIIIDDNEKIDEKVKK